MTIQCKIIHNFWNELDLIRHMVWLAKIIIYIPLIFYFTVFAYSFKRYIIINAIVYIFDYFIFSHSQLEVLIIYSINSS